MAEANLLHNGALNDRFRAFRKKESLQTAAGWGPWWLPQKEEDHQWANQRPLFAPATLDGRVVQSVSTPWGTHVGGLFQQVPAAAGNRYALSAEALARSGESAEAGSQQPADPNVQIGIDPTGGLDPASPLIIWSNIAQPLNRWQTLRLEAEAQAAIITIYLRSSPSLPRREQAIFWRNATLSGIGRYRRQTAIVGAGDTHITLAVEQPEPDSQISVQVSSSRNQPYADLLVWRPDGARAATIFQGLTQADERYLWRYEFVGGEPGLYEARFVADEGAQLLALRLVQVAEPVQLAPGRGARHDYRRVYVLLPPTADEKWVVAAARGGFERRFTVGFSADDAGAGDCKERHVLAINPHHWPEVLTDDWFRQHYPGVIFTPLVANKPGDLEEWLREWEPVSSK